MLQPASYARERPRLMQPSLFVQGGLVLDIPLICDVPWSWKVHTPSKGYVSDPVDTTHNYKTENISHVQSFGMLLSMVLCQLATASHWCTSARKHYTNVKEMINDNNGRESDCQLFPELAHSQEPALFGRLTARLYNSTKLENWLLLGIGASNSWPLCPSAPNWGQPTRQPAIPTHLTAFSVFIHLTSSHEPVLIYSLHMYKGRFNRKTEREQPKMKTEK